MLTKLRQYLGVQYRYQEPDPVHDFVSPKGKLQSQWQGGAERVFSLMAALQQMPVAWVAGLEMAAMRHDDRHLQRLIHQIPEHQSGLASQLHQMTHNFQFAQILELVHDVAGDRA